MVHLVWGMASHSSYQLLETGSGLAVSGWSCLFEAVCVCVCVAQMAALSKMATSVVWGVGPLTSQSRDCLDVTKCHIPSDSDSFVLELVL